MKQMHMKFSCGIFLLGMLFLTSCRSGYEIKNSHYQIDKVGGVMNRMDQTWDKEGDQNIVTVLKPYKDQVDQMMYEVIGKSDLTMDKGAPESLLSNLVAEVLRLSAERVIGRPADFGLVNMGGLRNILPQGEITVGTVFEILPFENSLCVLTLKGSDVNRLLEAIASRHGEGISGARLIISKDGRLLEATVNGQPIKEENIYTVATIDYLADGNGDMTALLQAVKRECPDGAILRDLFLKYVRKETAAGRNITSHIDGRVTVK
ncbi:MAG: 5'-nucleotidase C-terminal domain-containing protein [Bacteroides sp.]